MQTQLSYFEDSYKFMDQARILVSDRDEIGPYLILNKTIFYPQGGGQPSDQGICDGEGINVPIRLVKMKGSEVRHYTDQDYSQMVGKEVQCRIDQNLRILHAKLHTGGHLLSNVLESLYPHWKAAKGHHFPGQSYVEFISKEGRYAQIDADLLQAKLQEIIKKGLALEVSQVPSDQLKEVCPDLPYTIQSEGPIRLIRIGDFPFSPCSGTHLKSLKELEGITITKSKIKDRVLKVNYDVK